MINPTRIHDKNTIELIKISTKKETYKKVETFMKEFKRKIRKRIKEREKIIDTIDYYIDNKYINLELIAPIEYMKEKELLNILEQIIKITRKLI